MLPSSRPVVFSLSVVHHFEHFTLKSSMLIEQAEQAVLERRESRLNLETF